MSIAYELSSDVAAAVLGAKKDASTHDANELVEVVMEVHSTLRRLTAEARRKTRRPATSPDAPPATSAASGQN